EVRREDQLHVSRALELAEYHVVHAAPRPDKRRGYDRERTALLEAPGCAEDRLGRRESLRVNSTTQDAPALARLRVEGAAEARERIEEDDDVPPRLHHPLRP